MQTYVSISESLPDDVLLDRIVPMLGVIPLFYLQMTSRVASEHNVWDHLASLRLDPVTGPRALAAIRKQGASRIRRLVVNMDDFHGEEDLWPAGLLSKARHIQILRVGDLWLPSTDYPKPVPVFLRALKQTLQFDRLTHFCLTDDTSTSNILPLIASRPRPNLRVLRIERITLSHESIDYVHSYLTLPNIEHLELTIVDDRRPGFRQIGTRWWPEKWLNLRPLFSRCNNPNLRSICMLPGDQLLPYELLGPFDGFDADFGATFGIPLYKFDAYDHGIASRMYADCMEGDNAHLIWDHQPPSAFEAMTSLHAYVPAWTVYWSEVQRIVHPGSGVSWDDLSKITEAVRKLGRVSDDTSLLAKMSSFLAENNLRLGPFPDDPGHSYIRGMQGAVHWDLDLLWNIAAEYFHRTGRTTLLNIAAHSRSFITRFILNAELRDEAMRLFEPGMRIQDIRGLYYQEGYADYHEVAQLETAKLLAEPLIPPQFRLMNPQHYFTSLGLDYTPLFET